MLKVNYFIDYNQINYKEKDNNIFGDFNDFIIYF